MEYKYVNRGWHELLKLPKMTKAALAKKMNITEQTLYRYLDNKTVPLMGKILEACNKFNLDLSYFIKSNNSMTASFDSNCTKALLDKKELEISMIKEYEQKIRDISLSYMEELTTTKITLQSRIKELETLNSELVNQNKELKNKNNELINKLSV